jgi:hypothetical protein
MVLIGLTDNLKKLLVSKVLKVLNIFIVNANANSMQLFGTVLIAVKSACRFQRQPVSKNWLKS